jgi:hypothetical protein
MSLKQAFRNLGMVVAITCVLPAVAVAADRGPIDQDFGLSLGTFFMQSDTQIRLDAKSDLGTEVGFEHEFGLEDKDRFRIDGYWRFADRHKVRFMYFEDNRGKTATLSRDIVFGDHTYPVNVTVDAQLDVRIIELAYEYAFLRRENIELSGSAGIHNIKLGAGLRGDASVTGVTGSVNLVNAHETASGDGPLPVLGAHLLWNMGHNFFLDTQAQFFFLDVGDFAGGIQDLKLGVTWFPFRNVGIGLGYNRFTTRVDFSTDRFAGQLKLKYAGPLAQITVGF